MWRASTVSARTRCRAPAAPLARCCSTRPRPRASNCAMCAASRSSTSPNILGSTPPRAAISNSPKRCAAPNARRCARCWTPAARPWAAACCATGCIIRHAKPRSPRHASKPSARCSTRRLARASTRCAARCGRSPISNGLPDVSRLLSARPRDLSSLRDTFIALPELRTLLAAVTAARGFARAHRCSARAAARASTC